MRLFIAIDVGDALREQLRSLHSRLNPQIRPIPLANLHITLAFIGNAEPDLVIERLQGLRRSPFQLHIDAPGRFPNRGGSTHWLGIRRSQALLQLHRDIAGELRLAEQDYVPHISLFRQREDRQGLLQRELEMWFAEQQFDPLNISSYGLYESRIGDGPPVYRCLRQFDLEPA